MKVNLSVTSRKLFIVGGASCLLVGIAMLGVGLHSAVVPLAVLVGSFSLCVGAVSNRNLPAGR
jgi:hypothetical protein